MFLEHLEEAVNKLSFALKIYSFRKKRQMQNILSEYIFKA